VESIQSVSLDLYETIIDNIQYELDGKSGDFLTLVDRLNNKYLDIRARTPGNIPQVFIAHESKNDSSVYGYRKGGSDSLKSKPCFNYQRNKTCSYGDKCKYSHEASICDTVNLTYADIEDQCVYQTSQADTFRKFATRSESKYKRTNSKFKDYRHKYKGTKPVDTANTADQKSALDKIKNGEMNYEDAVKIDPAKLRSIQSANVVHDSKEDVYDTSDSESITDDSN